MLNIVTGPTGHPGAVLIRGIEGCGGPGKLTKALKIDKKLNAQKALPNSGLWFEERGLIRPGQIAKGYKIIKTPRIGVQYAGPVWAKKKYRFVLMPKSKPTHYGRLAPPQAYGYEGRISS